MLVPEGLVSGEGPFHIDTSVLYCHMEGGNNLPGAFYKNLTLSLKVLLS